MSLDSLRPYFKEHNQDHVFKFADKLSEEGKQALYDELKPLDLKELNKIFKSVTEKKDKSSANPSPFPDVCRVSESSADRKRWNEIGFEKIAEGKLGLLLLAGGQGTRLGTVNPKGMYDIGLPSGKSLFQLQAERLHKLLLLVQERSGKEAVVPWYIMTSESTDATTREFFSKHSYFGLNPQHVYFFEQEMLPCVTPEGKILMETPTKVSRAPNGNGGLYYALLKSGALGDMKKRGLEMIYQYCVDNSLVKMADPIFAGFCFEKKIDVACKVIPKAYPEEPVGVLCCINNKSEVIEYSEIDPALAKSVDPITNQLRFNAAHICMNMFSVKFLDEVASNHLQTVPYHIARKKIPAVTEDGATVTPDQPNGWKLEAFIFDVFDLAQNMAAFEVLREEEFSPLKNAPGALTDSPETCRRHVSNLHKKYLKSSGGVTIPSDDENSLFEIAPRVSYAGEGLEHYKGATIQLPAEIKN